MRSVSLSVVRAASLVEPVAGAGRVVGPARAPLPENPYGAVYAAAARLAASSRVPAGAEVTLQLRDDGGRTVIRRWAEADAAGRPRARFEAVVG
jgi:hypothetical protein